MRRSRHRPFGAAQLLPALLLGACLAEEDEADDDSSSQAVPQRADQIDQHLPYTLGDQNTLIATPLAGDAYNDQPAEPRFPVPPHDTDEEETGHIPEGPKLVLEANSDEASNQIQITPPQVAISEKETTKLTVTQHPASSHALRKTVISRTTPSDGVVTFAEIKSSLLPTTEEDDAVVVSIQSCGANRHCRPKDSVQLEWNGQDLNVYNIEDPVNKLLQSKHPFAQLCESAPSSCTVFYNNGREQFNSPEAHEGGENDRE